MEAARYKNAERADLFEFDPKTRTVRKVDLPTEARSSSSIAALRSKRYRRHTVPSVPTVPALRAFQTRPGCGRSS